MNTEFKNPAEMSGPELVAEFNRIVKKLDADDLSFVRRFANRDAGIRRVNDLRDREQEFDLANAEPKVEEPKEVDPKRSAGVAASWLDEDVKRKRSTRHNVRVDGIDYRSVRSAFIALGLPLNFHIQFRMALKEAGKLHYEGMDWELI